MTEKQKMISGEKKFSSDDQLVKERKYAKNLCFEFNNLRPSNEEKRADIIKKLFGKMGKNAWVEPSFNCDYGYNIFAGDNFYSNHNLVILDVCKVTFGSNVFIGPNVGIYTAEHPLDVVARNKMIEYGKPITIGNNVWIGGSVSILAGVTIGDNAVIGAGSVVTKDLPSNVVAVGNPCKVIRSV